MYIAIIMSYAILIAAFLLLILSIRKHFKLLINTITQIQNADEHFDKRELTSYELERLEREEEFDNRISRLKDELAQQQNIIRKGYSADELHPLVHNLPHDAVQIKYESLPDVEIAD